METSLWDLLRYEGVSTPPLHEILLLALFVERVLRSEDYGAEELDRLFLASWRVRDWLCTIGEDK